MKKIQIEETLERSLGDIVGDIQEVIDYLEGMKKEGWEGIDFDWDDQVIKFVRYRLETDKEFERRVKKTHQSREKNKALKEIAKKKEYEQYLKLKEKFEK